MERRQHVNKLEEIVIFFGRFHWNSTLAQIGGVFQQIVVALISIRLYI